MYAGPSLPLLGRCFGPVCLLFILNHMVPCVSGCLPGPFSFFSFFFQSSASLLVFITASRLPYTALDMHIEKSHAASPRSSLNLPFLCIVLCPSPSSTHTGKQLERVLHNGIFFRPRLERLHALDNIGITHLPLLSLCNYH